MVAIRVKPNNIIQTLSFFPLSIKHLAAKNIEYLILIENTIKPKPPFNCLLNRWVTRIFFLLFSCRLLWIIAFNIVFLFNKIPCASCLIKHSQSCNRLHGLVVNTPIEEYFLGHGVFNHESSFTCLRLKRNALTLLYLNIVALLVICCIHLFNIDFNCVESLEHFVFTLNLVNINMVASLNVFFYNFRIIIKLSHSFLNFSHCFGFFPFLRFIFTFYLGVYIWNCFVCALVSFLNLILFLLLLF